MYIEGARMSESRDIALTAYNFHDMYSQLWQSSENVSQIFTGDHDCVCAYSQIFGSIYQRIFLFQPIIILVLIGVTSDLDREQVCLQICVFPLSVVCHIKQFMDRQHKLTNSFHKGNYWTRRISGTTWPKVSNCTHFHAFACWFKTMNMQFLLEVGVEIYKKNGLTCCLPSAFES